jgi:hypothetical protein
MKKILIRSIEAVLIVLASAATAAVTYLHRVDFENKLISGIETSGGVWLDRKIQVGAVALSPSFFPAVIAYNVRVWEPNGRLLAFSPTVEAEFNPFALLSGTALLSDLTFHGGRLMLRGRGLSLNVTRLIKNVLRRKAATLPRGRRLFRFALKTISIDNVALLYTEPGARHPRLAGRARGAVRLRNWTSRAPTYRGVLMGGGVPAPHTQVRGRFGPAARFEFKSVNVPVKNVAPVLPFLEPFEGRASGSGRWTRKDGRWRADINAAEIRPRGAVTDARVNGHLVLDTRGKSTVQALVSGTSVQATVNLAFDLPKRRLDVSLTGERVNAADAVAWWRAARSTPTATQKAPAPWTGRANAAVTHLTIGSLTADDARAHAQFDSARVSIDSVTFHVWGGTVTSRAALDRAAERIRAGAQGQIRLEALAAAFQGRARVSGLSTFDINLNGPQGDFLNSSTGTAVVMVDNGDISGVPALAEAVSHANLTSLVDKIKGDSHSGFPFDHVEAHFNINHGVIGTAEPLVIENDTMRLSYNGVVNWRDKTLDGKILIQVLTLADEVIRAIPVVRDLFMGDQKSFLPIYANVTGAWSAPEVEVVRGKTLTRPITGLFHRVINLPKRFWDHLTGNGEHR